MDTTFFKNWWLVGLRGLIAVIFGIVAFAAPQDAILVFALYFGVLMLLAGIFITAFALQNKKTLDHWKYFLAEGIIDLLFGIAIIANPGMTIYLFTIFIGAWLLVAGGFQIWFAIRYRSSVRGTGFGLLNGFVTSLLGLLILLSPLDGIVTLTYLIGFAALCFGSFLIYLAYRMRQHNGKTTA